MSHLKYYTEEKARPELKEAKEINLTDAETAYVFERLCSKYKLAHRLKFFGNRGSGNCSSSRIRISHNPSILTLAHEVAHAIQFRKRWLGKMKQGRWHNKWHSKKTVKVADYILSNLVSWKIEMSNKETRKMINETSKKVKEEEKKQYANSPEGKMKKLDKSMKKWLTKLRRATTMLKKLNRRKKILEKKLSVRSSMVEHRSVIGLQELSCGKPKAVGSSPIEPNAVEPS